MELPMITFKFSEEKTTQAAALLINLSGRRLNYTKLIKLLYLADRESLKLWERPISGDSYVSMHLGPVLSRIYDLINYEEDPDNKRYWYRFILKNEYDVSLIHDAPFDELSKREIDLLERIFSKYKGYNWKKMVDVCHEICREWKDPGDSSFPIYVDEIFKALGKTDLEITSIQEEISDMEYANLIFDA
jgi:uncharacterized phage-associated protein